MMRNGSYLLLVFLTLITSCEVEFTPSITPVEWYTEQGQSFDIVPSAESSAPTPTSIFTVPQPKPTFVGMDSLRCTEPKRGDTQYGYCRIPGEDTYYVWGPCLSFCSESPYADIEVLSVSQSDTLYNFINVIDRRDDKTKERREKYVRGGILGSLGIPGAILGVGKLCIVSGSWNWGIGCGVVLVGVGIDLYLVGADINAGNEASDALEEPLGLEDSAQELFERLQSPDN